MRRDHHTDKALLVACERLECQACWQSDDSVSAMRAPDGDPSDTAIAAVCKKCLDDLNDLSGTKQTLRWSIAHIRTLRALISRGYLVIDHEK